MKVIKAPNTKIEEALQKFELITYYVAEQTDLKKIQENIRKYHYLNREHPLVIELLSGSYAVLTKFGTVSFWNVKKPLEREFMREIMPYLKGHRTEGHEYTDTLKIFVGQSQEKITFEELYLHNLDLEKIKIISYVSGQSVALDRYEEDINIRLTDLEKVVENLKVSGHTKFSQSSLLRQVGNILSVKQNTVSSLSLFDKPDETWEREEIEKLYDKLRREYELRDRFDILNEKIDFLSENNTTLMNFIVSQRSNNLEIIVIVLIVIEIALFIFQIFAWAPH